MKAVKANNTKRHGVVHSWPKRMTPEFLDSMTTLDGDLAVDSVLTARALPLNI